MTLSVRECHSLATGAAALEMLNVDDEALDGFTSALSELLDESNADVLARIRVEAKDGGSSPEQLRIDLRGRDTAWLPWDAPGATVTVPLPSSRDRADALRALPAALRQLQSPRQEIDVRLDWDWAAGSPTTLAWAARRAGGTAWVTLRRMALGANAELLVGAAALYALGQLGGAYLSKLGELLGESSASVLRRMWLRRQDRSSTLTITVDQAATVIVLPDGELTDEAKLALIDLDLTADGICGRTLSWDPETQAWRTEPTPPPEL